MRFREADTGRSGSSTGLPGSKQVPAYSKNYRDQLRLTSSSQAGTRADQVALERPSKK